MIEVLGIPAIQRHICNCFVSGRRSVAPLGREDILYVHPEALTRMYVNDELTIEEFEAALEMRLVFDG